MGGEQQGAREGRRARVATVGKEDGARSHGDEEADLADGARA